MTGTLTFNNIKLYGFHGIYEVEAKIGTLFILNIKAVLKADYDHEIPTLENTVNYEELYEVVKIVFNQRESLIETVALNINKALKPKFPQAEKWQVCIKKQNPLGVGSFNPEFCLEN